MNPLVTCPYCGKPMDLSPDYKTLVKHLGNQDENGGEQLIPLFVKFLAYCNAPDDPEISKLDNTVRKYAGAYKEFKKLPYNDDKIHSQLVQIGQNILHAIVTFKPIPSMCRHEIVSCEWCYGGGCEWCPNNIGVDQRNKRWAQHIRKCDAGYLIRVIKRARKGSHRVATRADRLLQCSEDDEVTVTGLFD